MVTAGRGRQVHMATVDGPAPVSKLGGAPTLGTPTLLTTSACTLDAMPPPRVDESELFTTPTPKLLLGEAGWRLLPPAATSAVPFLGLAPSFAPGLTPRARCPEWKAAVQPAGRWGDNQRGVLSMSEPCVPWFAPRREPSTASIVAAIVQRALASAVEARLDREVRLEAGAAGAGPMFLGGAGQRRAQEREPPAEAEVEAATAAAAEAAAAAAAAEEPVCCFGQRRSAAS